MTDFFLAPGGSTTIVLSDGSEFEITFDGMSDRTWCYIVKRGADENRGLDIDCKDLSHWLLGIGCHVEGGHIVGADGGEIGYDGSTGLTGVKWGLDDGFTEGTFCITLDGDYAKGLVRVVVKAGNSFASGFLPGPTCESISGIGCVVHDQGGGF